MFAQEGYEGLRINLADLLLPVTGMWVIYSLFHQKTLWPNWKNKYIWLSLMALIIVMSVSLLNGYHVNGYLSGWAFLNKYIGFFVLLAYFLLGGWLASNSSESHKTLTDSLRAFCGFFTIVILTSSLLIIIQPYTSFSLWLPFYPWDGLMANRNAFAVLGVMVGVFLLWGPKDLREGGISRKLYFLFWLFLPFFLVYNASRTAWITLALLLLLALFTLPFIRGRKIILLLLMGSVLVYGSTFIVNIADIVKMKQFNNLIGLVQNDQKTALYVGDKKRLIAVEDGWALYKRSNPLIGAGLGTYKPFQIEKRGAFVDIIDFTALWLLVETGILGLGAFVVFFLMCLWTQYKEGVKGGKSFHTSMAVFLLAFAFMAGLHELAYTRFVWFFLGLFMAMPRARIEKKSQSS